MPMTAERPTRARVHTFVSHANPYLVCQECRRGVCAGHDAEKCGCGAEGVGANVPCGHAAGTVSVCPAWSPTRGCGCAAAFREVDHPTVFDLGTRVRS